MANLIQHLTSISPDLRSGPSPGRRLLAVTLCSMLVVGSVFPGAALAGESDSEGEGTSPSIELPESPDFDPAVKKPTWKKKCPPPGTTKKKRGPWKSNPKWTPKRLRPRK